MLKKIIYASILFILFSMNLHGQKSKLAYEYYNNGEYEKAAVLFKSLYKQNQRNFRYFELFLKSLLYDEQYEDAKIAIKKELKNNSGKTSLLAWLGYVHEMQGDTVKAQKYYKKAIDKTDPDSYELYNLANIFKELVKYDLALQTYEKGLKHSNKGNVFLNRIADIYFRQGKKTKMIDAYLDYISRSKRNINLGFIKNRFAEALNKDEIEYLRKKIIEKIQDNPDNISLISLLSWVYVHNDNYKKALRQIIAIDRRYNEDGRRVYMFGQDSKKAGKYKVAAKAFQYIIKNKDKSSPYYYNSLMEYLATTENIISSDTSATVEDYKNIESQYYDFISQFGINNRTAGLILDLARLQAYKLHNLDAAVKTLLDFINKPYIRKDLKAKAKLLLGDIYLIKGEIWEASLLYSQVDKDFKEGELGEQARFKNGKLYYYTGDFEWAQTIFDILKPATTKLISNDAIESSVFISETLGEDSLANHLKMYAKAELLILQNKFDEAISTLDSINFLFPGNNLEDDIWYAKAHIFQKQKKYDLAEKMYLNIIKKYPNELRADNAIFELAQMYENEFHDNEKAKSYYEKLFLDYPSSTLAVEARKKYRELNENTVQ